MAPSTLSHNDYTVAWICALPLEMAAAKAMLTEIHSPLPQSSTDPNAYVLGGIYGHHIVVACLPSGVYGTTSAAMVISHLVSTFPKVQFGLMVGIGGGVPFNGNDIRLGDIVVSKPTGSYGGVVQYDYGKTITGGKLHEIGIMNQPSPVLLTSIARLQADQIMGIQRSISEILSNKLEQDAVLRSAFLRPKWDYLFPSHYAHVELEDTCEKCDMQQLAHRNPRSSKDPQIHYGLIASGNQVMKDAQTRDRLAQKSSILCFEMEAAGMMNQLPCLVIRGICDYADSHKNKEWQGYAAVVAAAYTILLLSVVPVTHYKTKPEHRM
jgi:nucleoside phosphorylase